MGWCDIHLTEVGKKDKIFEGYESREKIFQLHGDTFDPPTNTVQLAWSEICQVQAFRFGEKVYGLQFHLEVDQRMIHRWLQFPENKRDLADSRGLFTVGQIEKDTLIYIDHSLALSLSTFSKFIELFGYQKSMALGSGR